MTGTESGAPTTEPRPALLVVESRRARFLDSVLARTDIDCVLLRLSSAAPVDRPATGAPVFVLDERETLEREAGRYDRWLETHGIRPSHFCNPNEAAQPVAHRFAEAVGLPHLTDEQVRQVHVKPEMKTLYEKIGLPSARYAVVDSQQAVHAFAAEFGWPLILKPIDSDTCLDTYKLRGPDDPCTSHADRVARKWMVEEYISGNEFQLCALVFDGRVLDAYLSRNPAPIISVFDGAMNANITLAPSEAEPVDSVWLAQTLTDGIGYGYGYLHGELFIRPDGSFVMGEVAARLSGCEVPMNHGMAYGFDVMTAISDLYVGRAPTLEYLLDRSVGDLLLPTAAGRVVDISSAEELAGLPGVVHSSIAVKVDDRLTPPRMSSACSGYVHVEGRSSLEVQQRMATILANFRFVVEA